MPEPGDLWDAQHYPNKIPTVEEKNWVSSDQSCSEGSESIEQTFMDKGVVPQGTKDEKNKKVEAAGRKLSTQQQKIPVIWEK